MSIEENVESPVTPNLQRWFVIFDIAKFVSGNNKYHPVVQLNGVRWC